MIALNKILDSVHNIVLYLYIHHKKILCGVLFIYFSICIVDFLCFHVLLKYSLAMNAAQHKDCSTFVFKNGTAKVVDCESIQNFLNHVRTDQATVVRRAVGPVEIIGNNVTKQSVIQYSRVNQYVIDTSHHSWLVRQMVKVTHAVAPQADLCMIMKGEVFTESYLKSKKL